MCNQLIKSYKKISFKEMQGADQAHIRKESEEFLIAIKLLDSSNKWTLKSQKKVTVWQQDVQGRTVIKACTIIDVPLEKVIQFFRNPDFMRKIQDNVEKFEKLWSGDNLNVFHAIMKMPGPVSNRQIVAVNTFKQEGDKVILGNRSCNYPVQLDKNAELAKIHVGGFIFEKADAGKTKLTNISDFDPKGSIPGFVKNAMAGKRAQMLQTIEDKIKAQSK